MSTGHRNEIVSILCSRCRGYCGHFVASRIRPGNEQILGERSIQIPGEGQSRDGPVDEPGHALRLELADKLD